MLNTISNTVDNSDGAGGVYFSEVNGHVVRHYWINGSVTRVAGSTSTPGSTGDGGAALVGKFNQPLGVALDNLGGIYVAGVCASQPPLRMHTP